MPLTFGLTGMDPTTESSLKAAFNVANTRGGNRWQLLPETEADFVVVDMDSMYGPMSWLRLHAAGKRVIGLTAVARTQTDFRLERPFDSASVGALLRQLDEGAPPATDLGEAPAAAPVKPAPAATPATPPPPAKPSTPPAATPSPAGMTPAPQPQDLLPEELPAKINVELAPPPEPLAATPADTITPVATREPPSAAAGRTMPPAPTLQPHVPSPPPAPVEPRTLGDWLASGRLNGRLRFDRNGSPILIDAGQRQYYGPGTLKAIAGHFSGDVALTDFHTLDEATWNSQRAPFGEPQPLARLVWFGGLLASKGVLAPGFDAQARYQLLKWPQTEREFPKHFRIATAMMKGPATLAEIAEASGVPLADVTDFLNASLATGFAGPYREPEPETEPPKPSGLFGRLRGR